MKIGMLSEFYYPQPGGVSEHIRAVSQELTDLGHDVVVLTSNIRGDVPETGARVRRVGSSFPIRYNGSLSRISLGWRLGSALRQVLREEDLDVLHVHNPLMPTLPLLALRHASCPVVATFHSYYQRDLLLEIFQGPLRKLLSRTQARVPVSLSAQKAVTGLFPGDYQIIPNGVDYDFFSQAVTLRKRQVRHNQRRYLLFVGAQVPRKGLPILLHAFPRIAEECPDVDLLVVGDGPGPDRMKRQVPRPLRERVHFLGCLPRRRLLECFTSADIFCAPSLGRESFGMVLLEAMAAGVPVVASDIEGYRNVVTHDRDGYLIPPGSPDLWSQTLLNLLGDDEARAQLSRAGRRTAWAYRWRVIAERLESIYSEVLGISSEEALIQAENDSLEGRRSIRSDGRPIPMCTGRGA